MRFGFYNRVAKLAGSHKKALEFDARVLFIFSFLFRTECDMIDTGKLYSGTGWMEAGYDNREERGMCRWEKRHFAEESAWLTEKS